MQRIEGDAADRIARELSARTFATLEHQHLAAGLGEIVGGDQAVVARADDDRVV